MHDICLLGVHVCIETYNGLYFTCFSTTTFFSAIHFQPFNLEGFLKLTEIHLKQDNPFVIFQQNFNDMIYNQTKKAKAKFAWSVGIKH